MLFIENGSQSGGLRKCIEKDGFSNENVLEWTGDLSNVNQKLVTWHIQYGGPPHMRRVCQLYRFRSVLVWIGENDVNTLMWTWNSCYVFSEMNGGFWKRTSVDVALADVSSGSRSLEQFLTVILHGVWRTHINFQLIRYIVLLVTPTQINTSSYRD